MGSIFRFAAGVIGIVGALWSYSISFGMVREAVGFLLALLSTFIFIILDKKLGAKVALSRMLPTGIKGQNGTRTVTI